MKHHTFLVLILLFLAACKKSNDAPDPITPPITNDPAEAIKQLNIPDGFDYVTTKTSVVRISAKTASGELLKNIPFGIYMPGGVFPKLITGGTTGATGIVELDVQLPVDVDTLVFQTPYLGLPSDQIIRLTPPLTEITFGDENQLGFSGGGKDAGSLSSRTSTASKGVLTRGTQTLNYMGSFDKDGVPGYLEKPADNVKQEFLDVLNASLPENYSILTNQPEFLEEDLTANLNLSSQADVWLTFVHEATNARNAIGYYTYPTGQKPAAVEDIQDLTVVFPNASFSKSGGKLVTGSKVHLGTFPAGTSIGWFLVPDGWNATAKTVDWKEQMKFSDKHLNTFAPEGFHQHTVLLKDPASGKFIIGMEDQSRPNTDGDFNDVVLYATVSDVGAQVGQVATAVSAIDEDGDGVSNAFDFDKKKPSVASTAYTPAKDEFGSLAFEDLYPNQGDYDMNDLVIDYNVQDMLDASGSITETIITLRLRAMGGVLHNGFGIQLPVSPDMVESASGTQLINNNITLTTNGLEAKQSKAVVIAFDDGLYLLGGGTQSIVNTLRDKPTVPPATFQLRIVFKAPVTRKVLGFGPFNPFIFIGGIRGKEVHLPGFLPTDAANKAFLGSGDDGTDPAKGKYYKTESNLPFAINVPVTFEYPLERVSIIEGYLKFDKWAENHGNSFSNWYRDNPGFRDNTYIFK